MGYGLGINRCFQKKATISGTMGRIRGTRSIPSIQEYFPDLHGDLINLSWAHAVNNQSLLTEAIDNKDVMMLEADVTLGKLIGQDEILPIMGHPPKNESDLSLKDFIERVISIQGSKKKGIKLDFKSTEVFNASLPIIESLNKELNFPVWLNADILQGPIDSGRTPVDPDIFLKLSAKKFPTTTLSVGWTTEYGPSMSGEYSDEQLNEMKSVLERNRIKQPITLAVRAGIVAESKKGVLNLVEEIDELQNSNTTTLTIWMSSDSDPVDVAKLRDLILTLRKSRVYLDVPASLRDELNLDSSSAKTPISAAQGALVALLTSVTALFSNILKFFD